MPHLIGAGLALVLMLCIQGCTAEKPPLRVGLLVWPAYEFPHLAEEMGLYRDQPLQLVEFYSPAELQRAYFSGGLDAVAVTLDYVVQWVVDDPEQRIIFVIDASNGADALLARPDIESVEGLRGKRVGLERSFLGAFLLKRAMDRAGLREIDIEVVSVDVRDSVAAYQKGIVDAVVTYEPYRTKILALGARELFSSREIPGEILDVLVTRSSTLEEYESVLDALIGGWLRAAERLREEPLQTALFISEREGVTQEHVSKFFDDIKVMDAEDNRAFLSETSPTLETALRRQFEFMSDNGLSESEPDFRQLIDRRFFIDQQP